ncbi:21700_t:CDS:2, partial [Gigaspora rosea]
RFWCWGTCAASDCECVLMHSSMFSMSCDSSTLFPSGCWGLCILILAVRVSPGLACVVLAHSGDVLTGIHRSTLGPPVSADAGGSEAVVAGV